jgi:hypothetical protein
MVGSLTVAFLHVPFLGANATRSKATMSEPTLESLGRAKDAKTLHKKKRASVGSHSFVQIDRCIGR